MRTLLSTLLCAFLVSCASTSIPEGKKPPEIKPTAKITLDPKKASWNDMDDVRDALKGKPVAISGTTVDLRGAELNGSKFKKSGNDQSESAPPVRINIDKFVLRNGIVRGVPGGLVFRGDGLKFLKLYFFDIGEDALSNVVDDSPNATVEDCKFYNGGGDKAGQYNDARGLVLKNNYHTGGITGVRVQKKDTKHKNIKATLIGNTFEDVDTAINASGPVTVTGSGNVFKNVKTKTKTGNGAKYSEK